MATLTAIKSCSATTCAFNNGGCTAGAITIGGTNGAAKCGTFIELDARGGMGSGENGVGACHRLECAHNTDLMCALKEIKLVGNTASCEMYEAR